MGLCYTVMLQAGFDFTGVGISKADMMQKFSEGFTALAGYAPDLEAEWDGHVVYGLDKYPPYVDDCATLIAQCCDSAWYWDDDDPADKERLKFPVAPAKEFDPYA